MGFPFWLRPFLLKNVAAITLGRRIYVASGIEGEALERLLRHERVHVVQMQQAGIVRFLWRYAIEYVRNRARGMNAHDAYRMISFEAEAFAAEDGKPV